jgi:hypothetical protein
MSELIQKKIEKNLKFNLISINFSSLLTESNLILYLDKKYHLIISMTQMKNK